MDRRNFLKATGIIAAGLAFLGIMPRIQATEAIETNKIHAMPQNEPWKYKSNWKHQPHYRSPIKWTMRTDEQTQADTIMTATVYGMKRGTGELQAVPIAIPAAELDLLNDKEIRILQRRAVYLAARELGENNCIVTSRIG